MINVISVLLFINKFYIALSLSFLVLLIIIILFIIIQMLVGLRKVLVRSISASGRVCRIQSVPGRMGSYSLISINKKLIITCTGMNLTAYHADLLK